MLIDRRKARLWRDPAEGLQYSQDRAGDDVCVPRSARITKALVRVQDLSPDRWSGRSPSV